MTTRQPITWQRAAIFGNPKPPKEVWEQQFDYFEGENPLFPSWTPQFGGGGPYLWANDSHHLQDAPWREENIDFLTSRLTVEFVECKIDEATARLNGEPEFAVAKRMRDEFSLRRELVEERVQELPKLLREPRLEGWNI